MDSLSSLYVALQGLISVASGINRDRVVLADQGRPGLPGLEVYATYKPVPVRAYGFPNRERALTPAINTVLPNHLDFSEKTRTQLELSLSCNFLNSGAQEAAWKIHNANFRSVVMEYLYTYKIGWRYASNPRDLTNLLQAGLQQRYQIDVQLFVETEITDVVLRANGFSIEVVDEGGNLLYGAP